MSAKRENRDLTPVTYPVTGPTYTLFRHGSCTGLSGGRYGGFETSTPYGRVGYVPRRRAGRQTPQGAVPGLPRGAGARGGDLRRIRRRPAVTSAVFRLLSRGSRAGQGAQGCGRAGHRARRGVPVPAAVRAGQSHAARGLEGGADR